MKHWMMVLVAVSALAFTGCNKQESETTEVTTEETAAPAEEATETTEATPAADETPEPFVDTTPEAPATTEPAAAAPTPEPQAAAPAAGQEVTLPAGTKYVDEVAGSGEEATKGKRVVVHYTGTLEDGTQFDSSRGRGPFEFGLGAGEVIKGWDDGVAGMKVGGKRKLTIPASQGYGDQGAGGKIEPGATLYFDVELLAVK